MKRNLLTALMITVIVAAGLAGCGQSEVNKAEVGASSAVGEAAEAADESVEETNVADETEEKSEDVKDEAEEIDTSLDGADIVVPGESGFTYTANFKTKIEYKGEISEFDSADLVKFDGTYYYREAVEGSQKGSVDFCDVTDGVFVYHTIFDGEDMGWDTSSDAYFKGYDLIKELRDVCFENLNDNDWEYDGEENGMLIYTCKDGKSIHNRLNLGTSGITLISMTSHIYIDSETKELCKYIEEYSANYPLSGDADSAEDDMIYEEDVDEYVISDIRKTTVEKPEGMPEK